MACNVVDRAIQAFGAEGVSQDQELASTYAQLRTLRLADVGVCLSLSLSTVDDFLIGTGCSKYKHCLVKAYRCEVTHFLRSIFSRSAKGN